MNIVIITAGGVGTRMRSKDKPKQFLEIHGKPIIAHTLLFFENNENIDAIVISCVSEWITYTKNIVKNFNIKKVIAIVPGGKTGQLSIYNGLVEAKKIANGEKSFVLIHDAVRPLISQKLIDENIKSLETYGSSITVSNVKETVIEIDNEGMVLQVPKRSNARHARAPQGFRLNELLDAHEKALADDRTDFVDSCSLMQHYGYKLHVVEGLDENIKVTTQSDFYSMRAILTAKEDSQLYWPEED